eukprot:12059203-Alexandrium_andersonii.AAC.1
MSSGGWSVGPFCATWTSGPGSARCRGQQFGHGMSTLGSSCAALRQQRARVSVRWAAAMWTG